MSERFPSLRAEGEAIQPFRATEQAAGLDCFAALAMTGNMSRPAGKGEARWIPWTIVAFFVVLALLLSSFAWIAIRTYPGEVTAEAYGKGLVYNTDIADAAAQAKLGWQGALATEAHGKTLNIAFTLKDKTGQPVTGARIEARLYRPTQAGHDALVKLRESPGGVYRANAPLYWPGEWKLRVSATRGKDNYQQSKTIIVQ